MPGNPGHVSSACVAESKEDESKKLIKCAMTKLMLASSRLKMLKIIQMLMRWWWWWYYLDTQWLMLTVSHLSLTETDCNSRYDVTQQAPAPAPAPAPLPPPVGMADMAPLY